MTRLALPDDVNTLLARAAAQGIRVEQIHDCVDARDAIGHLVQAIRSTMLPRIMTIRIDQTGMVLCAVASGCLHHIQRIEPAPPAGGPVADLIGRSFSAADLDEVTHGLLALFADAREVRIDVDRPSEQFNALSPGLPAMRILSTLDLCLAPADPVAALDLFVTSIQDVLIAVHAQQDGPQILMPNQSLPPELFLWIDAKFAALAQAPVRLSPEEALFLCPPAHPSLAVCIVAAMGQYEAMITPSDVLCDIASCWASLHFTLYETGT